MIDWSEKFSVGNEKIDDQHQTFIELINRLETLTEMPNFQENLPILLNELVEYAALHFKTEEAIMEKAGYPYLDEHKKKHQQIKEDIYLECKKLVERDVMAMDVIWLYNYMKEWIKNHILEDDKEYQPYLNPTHE